MKQLLVKEIRQYLPSCRRLVINAESQKKIDDKGDYFEITVFDGDLRNCAVIVLEKSPLFNTTLDVTRFLTEDVEVFVDEGLPYTLDDIRLAEDVEVFVSEKGLPYTKNVQVCGVDFAIAVKGLLDIDGKDTSLYTCFNGLTIWGNVEKVLVNGIEKNYYKDIQKLRRNDRIDIFTDSKHLGFEVISAEDKFSLRMRNDIGIYLDLIELELKIESGEIPLVKWILTENIETEKTDAEK